MRHSSRDSRQALGFSVSPWLAVRSSFVFFPLIQALLCWPKTTPSYGWLCFTPNSGCNNLKFSGVAVTTESSVGMNGAPGSWAQTGASEVPRDLVSWAWEAREVHLLTTSPGAAVLEIAEKGITCPLEIFLPQWLRVPCFLGDAPAKMHHCGLMHKWVFCACKKCNAEGCRNWFHSTTKALL